MGSRSCPFVPPVPPGSLDRSLAVAPTKPDVVAALAPDDKRRTAPLA
jgi:hypothetical protein